MATYTSASAAKRIKMLQEEKGHVLSEESKTCVYVLAVGEEASDIPVYDYEAVREKVNEIDAEVLRIKHAIHIFNANTILPESGYTIDEALIVMAQLSAERERLSSMRARLPKERLRRSWYSSDSAVTEYSYANYDVKKASADYDRVCEELANLQLELDLANQTLTFEV